MIDEIEIEKSSIAFQLYQIKPGFSAIIDQARLKENSFSLEPGQNGFHDLEFNEEILRGYFSTIVPFEVEHLNEGITQKTLLRRVETCEFLIKGSYLFMTGKTYAQKDCAIYLCGFIQDNISPVEFENDNIQLFQNRLSLVRKVSCKNPKTNEVRQAVLTGRIEDYTEYNAINSQSHSLESVSGLLDTPLGPINVALNRKGTLRLGVKRGFILTLECLEWIFGQTEDCAKPRKSTEDRRQEKMEITIESGDGEQIVKTDLKTLHDTAQRLKRARI